MTHPCTLRAAAAGDIGHALVSLIEQRGCTASDFARLLGCGRESLGRWIRNEIRPGHKYADKLCELSPGLRPLLELHGCFRRTLAPVPKSLRVARRRTASRTAAKKRAAKLARLDRIKLRHRAMRRRARLVEGMVEARIAPLPESRSGDYVDILSESVAADVHVEGL